MDDSAARGRGQKLEAEDLAAVRGTIRWHLWHLGRTGTRQVEEAVDLLSAFAQAIEDGILAGADNKRCGAPINEISRLLVQDLAALFSAATGQLPLRGTDDEGEPSSRFFDFVHYIYRWIGPPLSKKPAKSIDSDIQRYVDAGDFAPFIIQP